MPATQQFDPDDYRMTVGEHLEELRRRLILSLIGFIIAVCLCFWFAPEIVTQFCKPLTQALANNKLSTQLIYDEVAEGFMVVIRITLVTAFAIASPWILYQLWLFVAAGLYPNERKYVTKFLPLSITLLISGMLFVYFFILPWTLEFDIGFSSGIKLKLEGRTPATQSSTVPTPVKRVVAPVILPEYDGTPPNPVPNEIWIDRLRNQMMIFHGGQPVGTPLASNQLLRPEYKLSKYIDLVIAMLLAFGLCFQLPLVVLALERIGIIEIEQLKQSRRYVYFAMAILAAMITPGGDLISMIGLTGPLILLYELGVWLCVVGRRKLDKAAPAA
jgi:sec-independent protein translocase protein TatC